MSLSVCSNKGYKDWPLTFSHWHLNMALQSTATTTNLLSFMWRYVLTLTEVWLKCLPWHVCCVQRSCEGIVRQIQWFVPSLILVELFPHFSDHNESLARLLPPTRIAPYWLHIKAVEWTSSPLVHCTPRINQRTIHYPSIEWMFPAHPQQHFCH